MKKLSIGLRSVLITATLLLVTNAAGAQTVAEKAESAMHRVFGETSKVALYSLELDSTVTSNVFARTGQTLRGRVILREASDANGKLLGYGFVDDVRGKEQPITYITMIGVDGALADIEVLVYRESYGGEVRYDAFRKQFRGKKATSQIQLGRDIQSVAGATISSRAITTGAKKIMILFDELKKEKKL